MWGAPKCSSDVDVPAIILSQQNARLEDTAASAHFLPAGRLVSPKI